MGEPFESSYDLSPETRQFIGLQREKALTLSPYLSEALEGASELQTYSRENLAGMALLQVLPILIGLAVKGKKGGAIGALAGLKGGQTLLKSMEDEAELDRNRSKLTYASLLERQNKFLDRAEELESKSVSNQELYRKGGPRYQMEMDKYDRQHGSFNDKVQRVGSVLDSAPGEVIASPKEAWDESRFSRNAQSGEEAPSGAIEEGIDQVGKALYGDSFSPQTATPQQVKFVHSFITENASQGDGVAVKDGKLLNAPTPVSPGEGALVTAARLIGGVEPDAAKLAMLPEQTQKNLLEAGRISQGILGTGRPLPETAASQIASNAAMQQDLNNLINLVGQFKSNNSLYNAAKAGVLTDNLQIDGIPIIGPAIRSAGIKMTGGEGSAEWKFAQILAKYTTEAAKANQGARMSDRDMLIFKSLSGQRDIMTMTPAALKDWVQDLQTQAVDNLTSLVTQYKAMGYNVYPGGEPPSTKQTLIEPMGKAASAEKQSAQSQFGLPPEVEVIAQSLQPGSSARVIAPGGKPVTMKKLPNGNITFEE